MLKNKMAGLSTDRFNELSKNTRKNTSINSNNSSQMYNLLSLKGSNDTKNKIKFHKQPLVKHVDERDQKNYFKTRWRPDRNGLMTFCVERKNGSASVELGYDFIDREATYQTWKRKMNGSKYSSNLAFDNFLTVQEHTDCTDKLTNALNSVPADSNLDEHFKNYSTDNKPLYEQTSMMGYLAPKRNHKSVKPLNSHYGRKNIDQLGPAPLKTGLCPTNSELSCQKRFLRAVNLPWVKNLYGYPSNDLNQGSVHECLQNIQRCNENEKKFNLNEDLTPSSIHEDKHIPDFNTTNQSENTMQFLKE